MGERLTVGKIIFAERPRESYPAMLHLKRDIRELLGPESGVSYFSSDGDVTVSGIIPHKKMTQRVQAALTELAEALDEANKTKSD